jgi:prephenate dehydrogenase
MPAPAEARRPRRRLAATAPGPTLVVGCGLIGASAAAGWSAAGREVWGHDRRDLGPLVERRWLDRQVPIEALPEAAVVLLALPIGGILGALRRLPFRRGQLVTDAGGVKGVVAATAQALPPGVTFVGGHPLAGSERGGFEAARPDLFAGAPWALVGKGTGPRRVASLVTELGARPVPCGAAEHDRAVALTSHLPQLLATLVAAELEARADPLAAELVGPGGRGFLRLAESPWEVWRDVLEANRDELERAVDVVGARAGLPVAALGEEFAAAQRFARRLRGRGGAAAARSGGERPRRR